jgi:hypothetical protein
VVGGRNAPVSFRGSSDVSAGLDASPRERSVASAVAGDQLRANEQAVSLRRVPVFVSYSAFRSGDGGMTVTVCQDKVGTDESSRRAAEWVKENVSTIGSPPAITEGSTVLHF